MNLKRSKIKISEVIVLILGSLCFFYLIFVFYIKPNKIINQRCIDRKVESNFWGPSIDDCYGVISISSHWDMVNSTVQDHKHDYMIAEIKSSSDFKIDGEYLYLKNTQEDYTSFSTDNKTIFQKEFFIDGEVVTKEYQSKKDIPKYIKINYISGEVYAYLTKNDIFPEDLHFFTQIE